jgi:hypothetical protein
VNSGWMRGGSLLTLTASDAGQLLMRTTYLAGAALGLVAAVVFASATTGAMFARLLLMFVTPLPIALAGLGWGWQSAAIAGAVGSVLILLFASPAMAIAFVLTQAVPMVLLTYLALLSRPLADSGGEPAGVEWYPVGRLVVWAVVVAGLGAIYTLLMLGDLEALRKLFADAVKSSFAPGTPGAEGQAPITLSDAEISALSELMVYMLPPGATMSGTISLLFNLWLAGRVTLASGQLGRPWPDLAALTYPAPTPLAFGVMLVLATVLSGVAGQAASAFAGGLFVAYLLLGLATFHYTTRGRPWRPFALWTLYASIPLTQFLTAPVIAMVGLAETVLHLRARFTAPPAPPSQPNT